MTISTRYDESKADQISVRYYAGWFGAGIASILAGALLTIGCQSKSKHYELRGQVLDKNLANNEITVKHGDIPGFMPAMTMPYRIKYPAQAEDVEPGDEITADVVVSKDGSDYWLEDVRVTDESGRNHAQPQVAPRMLMPGEQIPDVALVNQDGRTIHLSDFAGKALLVTFIYTRCPMANFCPRLSSQFARIHNELKKVSDDYDRTHLLTVSFDPKYDTAPVLRKYGLAYLDGDQSGFAHWDFASTDAAHLRLLAQAFGLQYQEQDNQISHTMNIVLIAPDGKVAKFWSTDWTWTELMQSMQAVIHLTRVGG